MKRFLLALAFALSQLAFFAPNAAAVLGVTITAPTAGQQFGSPGTVTLTATATPTTGQTVTKVEFFRGGSTLIATVTSSPYTYAWVNPAPSTYSLTAKVTDSGNNTKTSGSVSIKVFAPPTVSITSPLDGDSFLPGDTISISASATAAPNASISKVQFFNGTTLLGQDTSPPYAFSWPNVAAGNYTLTAKATDNKTGTATSAPVHITVAVPHTPPDVAITSPASGSVSQGPANFSITATATPHDTGITITKVDFYNGSTLLGTATSPPYTYNWTNVPSGGYLLSAKATDSAGASTTSSLVYAIVDGADSCATSPPVSAADTATKLAAFGNLPLTFEENIGQTDRRVKFLSRGAGYQLFLTPSASVVALRSLQGRQAAIRMRFAGANAEPALTGLDRTPTTTNYLVGRDPASWRTHVANFARVRYDALYPGVDAVYHASQGQLEYDLHVAAHADPARIRLAFEGIEGAAIDEHGDLLLRTTAGTIAQKKPVAYQEIGGKRHEVRAGYRVLAKNTIAFELGAYDRAAPLVIDPVLVYSTYLGGSNDASGASAIALSRCGEAFVTGWTWATDYPTTPGAFDPSGDTHSRMGFVSKLNQSGTALLYSTYVTGITFNANNWIIQNTDLVSIAVDGTGHAYVAGSTNASDFPTTPNGAFPFMPSDPAGVVAKLTTDGGALAYATYVDVDAVAGIAVDASNNAYIAGAHQVRKLAVDGSSFVYSRVVDTGFGSSDSVAAVAVDGAGNAYATGTTFSTFLPVTTGAFETTRPNSTSFPSGFVAKVNPAGTGLVYGTYLGNRGTTKPTSIAVDGSGNVFVGGLSDGQGFPVVIGAAHMFNMDLDQAGNQYAFAARLSADGSHLDYFSWVGGMYCPGGSQTCSPAQSRANGIAVDSTGSAWIVGTTGSNRIPLTKPINGNLTTNGGLENFAIKLSPAGTSMVFGTVLDGNTVGTAAPDGNAGSNATGVQVDSIGSAYVAGWTDKLDYPTTDGAYQAATRSSLVPNAFVTKINETKDTTTTLAVSPTTASLGSLVTMTATIAGNAPTGTVTFSDGGTSIGTAAVNGTTAQLVTQQLGGGIHSLTASYGGDAHNNPSASTAVSVNVTNPTGQPAISMTGIADGATFTAGAGGTYTGASVTVTASAAAGNTLSTVTVYFGASTYYWTPNSPTFTGSVPLPALGPGFYTIYSAAVDNFGNITPTPTVRFVVNGSTAAPPAVSITAPTSGSSFIASDPIAFAASATPQGTSTIASITYYQGGNVLGSSASSPYGVTWSNPSAGTYSVMALAVDSTGARMLSAPVTVTVTSPPPPTVTITSPTNGASFNGPTTIPLAASAVPASGATITKVDFLGDGVLLGTSTTAPFAYSWTNASGGTHSITARATDTRGATTTSSPITITMTLPPPPIVSVTSPANGASFAVPASVSVSASATPMGGATITRIELYAGATLFGSGTSGTWNVVAPGTYALTAKAFDDHGGIGTSDPVSVTIVGDPNETITFIHNDFAGNPIAGTDLTGALVWKENYTPFGQRQVNATASSSNHQWFGGKVADIETGLSYFGARYYDPVVGRFMGIDAVGFSTRNLHSFNRYAYANSNPYRFVDPDGNDAREWFPSGPHGEQSLAVTLGDDFAAISAFVVGAATGNENLKGAAVQGMAENHQANVNAVILLGTMGRGKGAAKGAAAEENMLGARGVKTASTTLWRGEGKARLDVENPNPGQRPGQLHYQDEAGKKYLYDPNSKSFRDAPNSVNRLLENPKFKEAVDKGINKYLGGQ